MSSIPPVSNLGDLLMMMVTESSEFAEKLVKVGVKEAVQDQKNSATEAAAGALGVHLDLTA
ncbi:MAG: hypothetical protein AB7F75_03745 [Planctomycetota bacterium]